MDEIVEFVEQKNLMKKSYKLNDLSEYRFNKLGISSSIKKLENFCKF
jgi:hypothetical protein